LSAATTSISAGPISIRTIDLNAPAPFDRTAIGQTRSVAAANATRAILPVNGGVRQINVLTNLGDSDYNALQALVRYRHSKMFASVSYTLSKATNTTEPDGNGIGPNQNSLDRSGEEERGPSVVDQRPSRRDHVHLSACRST
jgi:hypothetical protein